MLSLAVAALAFQAPLAPYRSSGGVARRCAAHVRAADGEWPPTISTAERNARIVNHPLSDLWRLVRSSPAGMAAAEAARAAQSARAR